MDIVNIFLFEGVKIPNFGIGFYEDEQLTGFLSLKKLPLKDIFFSHIGPIFKKNINQQKYIYLLSSFVKEKKITIISKVDYSINLSKFIPNKFISFKGVKKTFINNIELEGDIWIKTIRRKHRYYVKKSLSEKDYSYSIRDKDLIEENFFSQIFSLYKTEMENKSAPMLFTNRKIFKEFLERNAKNVAISFCTFRDKICFFSLCFIKNNSAVQIMAASDQFARKKSISYGGFFNMYQYLFSRKINFIDLGGYDENNNHGVFKYKEGFGGKSLESSQYLICSNSKLKLMVSSIFLKALKSV